VLHGNQGSDQFGIMGLLDLLVRRGLVIVKKIVKPGQVHFELKR
jgi:hypothetical protein